MENLGALHGGKQAIHCEGVPPKGAEEERGTEQGPSTPTSASEPCCQAPPSLCCLAQTPGLRTLR